MCLSLCTGRDIEQSVPIHPLGGSWFYKELYYHPESSVFHVQESSWSHLMPLLKVISYPLPVLLWSPFHVPYIIPEMKGKHQDHMQLSRHVHSVCLQSRIIWFVLFSIFLPLIPYSQSAFLTFKIIYREQQRDHPAQQSHRQELLLLCIWKLTPHPMLSAPLWNGKSYSWINSLISTCPFFSMLLWAFMIKSILRESSCSTATPIHSRVDTSVNVHKQTSSILKAFPRAHV